VYRSHLAECSLQQGIYRVQDRSIHDLWTFISDDFTCNSDNLDQKAHLPPSRLLERFLGRERIETVRARNLPDPL
jgi:hypothetical protein